jgi:signal transduction histidine kinase/ActR/RegA family two-component response regulator
MLKRVGRRVGLSVGALYAAHFLLTVATVWNISRLVRAAGWVDHTKNVLTELAETQDIVTTAESNERAFLLTGDPRYLSRDVRTSLEGHFSRLEILVADNPPERRSVEELRDAALERLAELRSLDETRERDGLEEAAALVNPGATERVRRLVRELEEREKTLLRKRQAASRSVTTFMIATLAAGGALLLLLIVAFHRDLRRRDQAARSLAEARRSAEEANAQKDRFLASLSHELRTPLTPIFAGAQMLEGEDLSAAARETTAMIRRNVELETRLIDDLLDLARAMQGKIELRTTEVDLDGVVRHAVETCRPGMEARRIALRTDLEARSHHVRGDPARLEQVFWNLLKNATKFTPEGGSISIRSFNDPGGRIRLVVADTGIGISPDNLSRIFQPFEQGARARGFGGLGLGLSIAKAIVDQHGGAIAARSEGKGKGSVFEVSFPAIATPHGVGKAAEAAPAASVGGIRILVVEDHADTARAIGALLGLQGHEVVVAASIEEAVAAHRDRSADLLVTDVGLPDGSGLELPAALRSIRPVPGIVVSGYGMDTDLARSREAGFCAHLVKPVTAEKLAAAIELALRSEADAPRR